MSSQQTELVPLSQIVLVVDTVRLVSDGAGLGRDSKAAHFLHKAGIHHSFFPADKAGAAASFSGDDLYLLVLGQHRRGQIRDFRFMGEEDKPMNLVDDGDVFIAPESPNDDGMLEFECRSKTHLMKWHFSCLPVDKSRARLNGGPAPAPPKPAPPPRFVDSDAQPEPPAQPRPPVVAQKPPAKPEPPADDMKAEETVVRRQPVEATTNAAGAVSAPAQPQERNGDSMATKQPRSLIEHLILAFCESLEADPDVFATGVRGSGDINSRVKEAVVFVARQLNVPWADIAVGKGMPSASNAMTVFKRAKERYGTSKNDFGRMVDVVAKAIPDKFVPAENHAGAKSEGGKTSSEKGGPSKTRGPYKPRTPKGERPPKPEQAEAKPSSAATGLIVNAYRDMTIFVISNMDDFTPQKAAALAKATHMTEEQLYAVIGRVGISLKGQVQNLPEMVDAAKLLIEALKK